MDFEVISSPGKPSKYGIIYLSHQSWDDWFEFSTTYQVKYLDIEGVDQFLGTIKIGKIGLKGAKAGNAEKGFRYPSPPEKFSSLGEEYFSLGQEPEYYERLSSISPSFRDKVLQSLRDIAYNEEILKNVKDEPVTQISLLRSVPLLTVQEQFNRLAHGGARLTPYKFSYTPKYLDLSPLPKIKFEVNPNSTPPTNIHVLIGRNGVGKTTFLNELSAAFLKKLRTYQNEVGTDADTPAPKPPIASLVSVSFSAFDTFEPLWTDTKEEMASSYHYVGLKKPRTDISGAESLKGPNALAEEMVEASKVCLQDARKKRWTDALTLLESDPIFREVGIKTSISEIADTDELLSNIKTTFESLSSGHKIVLLTITKLVESVSEKSLVLLDEPEGHLHPPLLSAFLRALSDLLINRNAIAIIATHSPVVLQEVPRSCVWKINRLEGFVSFDRPLLETFGENVGTLTNEVFGLEVTSTGFHKMLWEAVLKHRDYAQALASFDGQLGAEGKALLRAMIKFKDVSPNVAR